MYAKNGQSDGQQPGPSSRISSPIEQPSASLGNSAGRSDNNRGHYQQINVPGDGCCLFWAVTLAYLIPVNDDNDSFQKRYETLFGNENTVSQNLSSVRKLIQNYNPLSGSVPNDDIFVKLVSNTFRNRVVNHMLENRSRFESYVVGEFEKYLDGMRNSGTWGGEPEIRAMSEMLSANISVSGATESQYGNGNTRMQLFHVNLSGTDEARNHYNFGLEQSIVNNYQTRLVEDTLKLKKSYDNCDPNDSTDNSINDINNDEVPLERNTVEDIAKIKWYGQKSKVIFKVSSVNELDDQLLLQYQIELGKSENQEKLLAVMINLGDLHWATLVIHCRNQQFHGHYVDSLGEELPGSIKNAWSQINNGKNNNIEDYTILTEKRTDKYNSGMFAFKDSESIMKKLQGKNVNVQQVQKQFKQNTYYCDSSLRKDMKKLAKKLEQKDKMEDKIKVCSRILKNLNEIKKFSYKNLNIFLFFLEAIALEDSSELGEDYLDKFKNEIIGSENSALVKAIRNLFLHTNYERVVEKNNLDEEMKKLVKDDINCENLFEMLKDYMNQVSDKLENNSSDQLLELGNHLKTKSEIESIHKNNRFGKVLNDNNIIQKELSKLFQSCIKQIGNKPNVAKGDEIMFNLIVNIMPILGKIYSKSSNKLSAKGLEQIRKFRNDFFHNFHAYYDKLERNFILKQGIHKLLDYFFKYYFSRQVFEEFNKLTPACSSQQTIEQKVLNLLQCTQTEFKDHYPADESSNIELEVGKEVKSFVHEYLKIMSVIDNEYVTKERAVKLKKSKNQVINRKMKVVDRKRIYKEFKMLKESFKENNSKGQSIKDLKTKLKTEYGIWIPQRYFKKMFEYYIESDTSLSQFEEIFNNDVCALISIKTDYKVPTQKVIEIYNKFIKEEEISDLLDKLKLPNQQKSSITNKLTSLRSRINQSINLSSYFNVKNDKNKKIDVIVDVVKTTRNLFEMLDDHILYPFLSMNIEEVFRDEIFLDYLLNEKINITSKSLTELVKVEYITPYVVELIIANKLTQGVIRTQEFCNIIKNLLTKDMYSKYIGELLEKVSNEKFLEIFKDSGRNLDLENVKDTVYQKICNLLNKDNIQNIYRLFKKPKHVAEILRTLNNNPGEIEIIQEAFRLLKHATNELYNNEEYDLVLKLLNMKEVDTIQNILLSKNSSDLDVLQVQRTVAQIKNKKGYNEDALQIFNNIKDKILHAENSNTLHAILRIEDIESDKLYLSLLVSSDIAFTKHLRSEYKESYKEYKALYDKVIKVLAINCDTSKLTYAIYNDNILKSEKYLNILALGSKYLNILKIRSDIAHELKCFANAKGNDLSNKGLQNYETKFNEVLQHYQDALNIYEEVYEIKRTDAVFSQDIVKNIRDIAFVNNKLAGLKLSDIKNEVSLNQALIHYNKALEMYAMVLTIQEKEQWETHHANSKTMQDILQASRGIAYTHNKLGHLKVASNSEDAVRHYKKALKVYEKVQEFQNNSDKEHEHTLNTLSDIAHTNNNLGRLKSQNNPVEALKHYEEASKIYEEVLKSRIRILGEEHDKTKKIIKNLEDTNAWMNKLGF